MESKDFFKHCQLQGVIVVVERLMTRLEEGVVGACLVSQLLGYGQMGKERGRPPLRKETFHRGFAFSENQDKKREEEEESKGW